MDMHPILKLPLKKKKPCDINFIDNIFKFSLVKQISIRIITQTIIPARTVQQKSTYNEKQNTEQLKYTKTIFCHCSLTLAALEGASLTSWRSLHFVVNPTYAVFS